MKIPAHIQQRVAELRRNGGTRAERELRDLVRLLSDHYGLQIVFQQPCLTSSGWYFLDYYSWAALIDFELDGVHHKDKAQRFHDWERTERLRMDCGIEVIRIDNTQVIEDPFGTALEMAEKCLKRLGREGELMSKERFELLHCDSILRLFGVFSYEAELKG